MEKRVMSFVNHDSHISPQMEPWWQMQHTQALWLIRLTFSSGTQERTAIMHLQWVCQLCNSPSHTHSHPLPSGLSLPYQCDRDGGECSGCRNSHRSTPCGLGANPLTVCKIKKMEGKIVRKLREANLQLFWPSFLLKIRVEIMYFSPFSSLSKNFRNLTLHPCSLLSPHQFFSSPRLSNPLQSCKQHAIFTSTDFLISFPISGVSFSLLTFFSHHLSSFQAFNPPHIRSPSAWSLEDLRPASREMSVRVLGKPSCLCV